MSENLSYAAAAAGPDARGWTEVGTKKKKALAVVADKKSSPPAGSPPTFRGPSLADYIRKSFENQRTEEEEENPRDVVLTAAAGSFAKAFETCAEAVAKETDPKKLQSTLTEMSAIGSDSSVAGDANLEQLCEMVCLANVSEKQDDKAALEDGATAELTTTSDETCQVDAAIEDGSIPTPAASVKDVSVPAQEDNAALEDGAAGELTTTSNEACEVDAAVEEVSIPTPAANVGDVSVPAQAVEAAEDEMEAGTPMEEDKLASKEDKTISFATKDIELDVETSDPKRDEEATTDDLAIHRPFGDSIDVAAKDNREMDSSYGKEHSIHVNAGDDTMGSSTLPAHDTSSETATAVDSDDATPDATMEAEETPTVNMDTGKETTGDDNTDVSSITTATVNAGDGAADTSITAMETDSIVPAIGKTGADFDGTVSKKLVVPGSFGLGTAAAALPPSTVNNTTIVMETENVASPTIASEESGKESSNSKTPAALPTAQGETTSTSKTSATASTTNEPTTLATSNEPTTPAAASTTAETAARPASSNEPTTPAADTQSAIAAGATATPTPSPPSRTPTKAAVVVARRVTPSPKKRGKRKYTPPSSTKVTGEETVSYSRETKYWKKAYEIVGECKEQLVIKHSYQLGGYLYDDPERRKTLKESQTYASKPVFLEKLSWKHRSIDYSMGAAPSQTSAAARKQQARKKRKL